ncbi:hypothetical protein ACPPVT_12205 [Angustibacter sp. McL0619]|uniref:hypothetical protein n=1 Tax=Angustibacter sp. McL0619 TaxID=3415676 RepID=UPI003CE70A54
MPTTTNPLPSMHGAQVVMAAPAPGPGNWAGAASAVLVDGTIWLVYRVRRPLSSGRGVAVVIARSSDGVHFEQVCAVRRTDFGAESFERPVLVPLPEGGWRLYLSCATPGSKHWWIDSLTAATVEGLVTGERRVVLPGDDANALKDPVIEVRADGWHMWVCCHPLGEPGHEDRMTTRHMTSADGLSWTDRGVVLRGRPGHWDARGARVTAVLSHDPLTVLYDGRPDAESNWFERTGVAAVVDGELRALDDVAIGSPHGDGALRYACAVLLPDGRTRFYFEASRPDGAHDLLTSVA